MNLLNTIKNIAIICFVCLFFGLFHSQSPSPLTINSSLQNRTIPLGGTTNDVFTVGAPVEALTGQNFTVNFTYPGDFSEDCTKKVIVESENLIFNDTSHFSVESYVQDSLVLHPVVGNEGKIFPLRYRFAPYTTCNGLQGKLKVTIIVECGEETVTKVIETTVVARAQDTWEIKKSFKGGMVSCGVSYWEVSGILHQPNGTENNTPLGVYSFSGDLVEDTPFQVVSNATKTYTNQRNSFNYTVRILNCSTTPILENKLNYNAILGDNCGTKSGTAVATVSSTHLDNPRLTIQKTVQGTLQPGESGVFTINVSNYSGADAHQVAIQDIIDTTFITITSINMDGTNVPINSSNIYNFLLPLVADNTSKTIRIYFTINANAPLEERITNKITYNYSLSSVATCTTSSCLSPINLEGTGEATVVVGGPKPIMNLTKCIVDAKDSYAVGDEIRFRILVSNYGNADFTGSLQDVLNQNQDLAFVNGSSSVTYWDTGSVKPTLGCSLNLGTQITPPPFTSGFSNTGGNTLNYTFNPALPFNDSNVVLIEFSAKIKPQNFGTKSNTAKLQPNGLTRTVNYYVAKDGSLKVSKHSDKQAASKGDLVTFSLKVLNDGTIPLNNIKISDALPSCFKLEGGISVYNLEGNLVIPNASYTGNVEISLPNTFTLQPGEGAIVKLTVRKMDNGNCCNTTVKTIAFSPETMSFISATNGNSLVCIIDKECCNIQDFRTELTKNQDGSYSLYINGGSIPLQEVEVAVVDHHVEYSDPSCVPYFAGIYGNLSTNQTQWSGLTLDSQVESNLTWTSLRPSLVNGTVVFTISQPDVLKLDCCTAEYFFCLKVRVKNANCDQCEKIVCPTKKDCSIVITDIANKCVKEPFDIRWESSNLNGNLTIQVISEQGAVVYQENNVQNDGQHTFQVGNIPCGKTYTVKISSDDGKCLAEKKITIACCTERNCCPPAATFISVTNYSLAAPVERKVRCGGTLEINRGDRLRFHSSNQSNCNDGCIESPSVWTLTRNGTSFSRVIEMDERGSANFTFNLDPGTYTLTYAPVCGGQACPTCSITIVVKGDSSTDCACEEFDDEISIKPTSALNESSTNYVGCGKSITLVQNVDYTIKAPITNCSGGKNCYKANWTLSYNGRVIGTGEDGVFNHSFTQLGTYTLTMTTTCGNQTCKTCTITINVVPGSDSRCECNPNAKIKLEKESRAGSNSFANGIDLTCGNRELPTILGGKIKLTLTEACIGTSKGCQPSNLNIVVKRGNTVIPAIGADIYNVSIPGEYTGTYNYKCGEKTCKECVVRFKVEQLVTGVAPVTPKIPNVPTAACKCDLPSGSGIAVNQVRDGGNLTIHRSIGCGQTTSSLVRGNKYQFVGPAFNCSDDKCDKSVKWTILKDNVAFTSGTGNTISSFIATTSGNYTVRFTPVCGTSTCKDCEIKFSIP